MEEDLARQLIGWKNAKPEWSGNYDFFQAGGKFDGELTPDLLFSPLDLPPILTAEETVSLVFRSTTLLERLCEADWLVALPGYDDEPYFASKAVYMALGRLRNGEKPPRSASEAAPLPGEPEIGQLAKWRHMKVGKAAELLGISPRTLSDYADRGLVPFLPIGKHRLFNLDEVIAHLKASAPKAGITEGDIAAVLR